MQNLSNRLKEIAGLVPKKCRVADIGTDHGYLPIYLVENGIALKVLACDVAKKPLETAKTNIEKSGLASIETRLSNGFQNINSEEIDAAVIAGIGGEVIYGIIDRCSWIKNSAYTLILQPTTSPEKLREYLNRHSFSIEKEIAVSENRKVYSIMQVKYSTKAMPLKPYELYIGKLKPDNESSIAYIEKQLKRITNLLNDIKNVPNKQTDIVFYSEIEKDLIKFLGGKYGA